LIGIHKPIVLFEKTSMGEVRGHCKCREMPVLPINKVGDKDKMIKKWRAM
jgi:hypothetical protein